MDQPPASSAAHVVPTEAPLSIVPPIASGGSAAPLLTYAPAQVRKRFSPLIFLCGFSTSILALALVYYLGVRYDFEFLGLYFFRFIPVGAFCVGIVAGSGYAIGARLSGIRYSGGLFLLVLLLQILFYFAAEYVFLRIHDPLFRISFWHYYNFTTTHLVWKHPYGNTPIGNYGYFLRFGEIAGFSIGGFLSAVSTLNRLHCTLCNLYLKKFPILTLPASIPGHYLGEEDPKILCKQEKKLERAKLVASEMRDRALADDLSAFIELCKAHFSESQSAGKLLRRICLTFDRCPTCRSGKIRADVIVGSGYEKFATRLYSVALPREFITAAEESLRNLASPPAQPPSSTDPAPPAAG